MIKLIATDIDGTLVKDSSPKVAVEIPKVMHSLMERGKICCVASGRQFYSIASVFHEVADKIVYIAENGAHIRYQGENLFVQKMNREHAVDIIEDFRRYRYHTPDSPLEIVVSTPDGSYLETSNQNFIDLIHHSYHNKYQVTQDILAEDITIIKIAFYQKGSIRSLGENILIPQWDTKVKACMAGEEWVDFMDSTVDKGHALKFLQEYFRISKEETMAFGDNANDIGMLQTAGESYAVENAREEVKQEAKYVCPPYWELGVYQVLKQLK